MKKCNKCHKLLSLDSFHKKKNMKDGLNNFCKVCRKNENQNKVKYIYYKKIEMGGKCFECGYDNLLSLEFHHLHDKISILNRLNILSDIDKEASKCQLICSFCHHLKSIHLKNRNSKVTRNYNFVESEKIRIKECCHCKRIVSKDNTQAFHFDHLRDKFENISTLCKQGYSIKTIINEIKKCQLLCANCHKIKTSSQFNQLSYL